MKRVACYARVSTDEQARFGFSIDAQKTALEKYCKDNKLKYDFYIDEGISARTLSLCHFRLCSSAEARG